MDEKVNEFSLDADRALLVVTRETCGPCVRYKTDNLPNTEALFRREKIPLLHVDLSVLSPYMQEEIVPYTPVFHLYSRGVKVATADMRQNRNPMEMLRWVKEYNP
jgi:hypothetical protein